MVSGYPTSMNLPWVDGLSTDPRDLGRHIHIVEDFDVDFLSIISVKDV